MKTSSFIKRNRIKYVLFGAIIGFTGGFTNYPLWYGLEIPPYGNILVSVYGPLMTYAVLRYRLMDIRLAVTRAGIFTLVYAFVLGIPFLIVKLTKPYLVGVLSDKWWIAILVVGMALAGAGPFIFMRLKNKAEASLLREEHARHEALRRVSQNILRLNRLNTLLRAITHSLVRILEIKLAAVYLMDENKKSFILKSAWQPPAKNPELPDILTFDSTLIKTLDTYKNKVLNLDEIKFRSYGAGALKMFELKQAFESLKAQLIVPAFRNERLIGFLALGDKRSERGYSQADIEVLTVLANQTTLAIENAIFNEEERERQAILFHSASLASLGTMASMMGHQVNNRFQAVNNLAGFSETLELLLESKNDFNIGERRELIQKSMRALRGISDEAIRGGEIVASIRRLGKLSSEAFKPITIRDVLDVALGILQYKIKFAEFDFNLDIPEALPQILGDSTQLGEVFFNLIDNAYDAIKERKESNNTPGYKAQISIKAYLKPDSKHIHIDVSDTGMGIKDEFKPRLFVPFYTTKASSGKGTGLGLHVIKRIIEFHNGKISVDSTYGKGTTFKIDLPIAEEATCSKPCLEQVLNKDATNG